MDLTVKEMKEYLKTQTTFDGRLVPDPADAYKVKQIIDKLFELIENG